MGAAVLVWIVMGLLAGLIVNKLVNRRGEGAALEIVLGIVGAVIGGWLFHRFGAAGATSYDLRGLGVCLVGAVVVLVSWHMIRGSTSRA